MAAKLITTIKRFIGTTAEMAALDITGVPVGSTFLVTDGGKGIYILDSSGVWVAKSDNVTLTGSLTGKSVSVSQTRPNDATAYAANDVVGTSPAANMTFSNVIANSGGEFVILGARLEIDIASIPSGMNSFRLHLYDAAPAAIEDNAAYNLPAGDRSKYLGCVDIPTPLDLGDTLWSQINNINFVGKLAAGSTSLYGILQTLGAYTPSPSTVTTVGLAIAPI